MVHQEQDLRQRAAEQSGSVGTESLSDNPNAQVCTAGNVDTFLVIDKSESMEREINGQKKLAWAKQAANSFVDLMATETTNYIGVASFARQGGVNLGFTNASPSAPIKKVISDLKNGSNNNGTCLECAMIEVNEKIAARKKVSPNKKFVIILSDGNINYVRKPDGSVNGPDFKKGREQAKGVIEAGIEAGTQFYLVGIGVQDNDGQKWLKGIADGSDGNAKYIYAGQGDQQLEEIYREIALTMGKVKVSGTVFEDLNKNDHFDATGDASMSGVMIDLNLASSSAGVASVSSDANGFYAFTDLCPETYRITQHVKQGYTQIIPHDPDYYEINVATTSADFTDKDFGNRKADGPTEPPTASPSGEITFDFKVALHGIGVAGDNVLLRPKQCTRNDQASGSAITACLSNQDPLNPQRKLTIELINDEQMYAATASGTMDYNDTTGTFDGNVKLTTAVAPGKYTFRASTPMFLKKKVIFNETVKPGKAYTLPAFDLTSSDVDNDNILTILDYNQIVTCYQFPNEANPCSETEVTSVDNDDNGVIDEFNVNLFVRDVSAVQGD